MSNQKQNILVAGANGTTGKIIVKLLKDSEDYRPVAMVRKQEQKESFELRGVSAVVADLESDLNHALKDIAKVIFAAGSKGQNLIGVDQEGAKRLTDVAKQAEAKKFVMLSSMGADDPSANKDLEEYLVAKHNADEHLKKSGMAYTIVRPGALTDDEGRGTIQLEEKFGEPGSISRADVAHALVEVLRDDTQSNQVFEILAGETPIEAAVGSA
jgi:uncharacterized protein YbjT (DUF2867 family)